MNGRKYLCMGKAFKIGGQFYPTIIGQFYAAIDTWSRSIPRRPSKAGRSSVLLRRGATTHAKAVRKDMAKNERSEDFGGVFMILWSNKKCLVGLRMAHDVVNPRMLELETAKEILAELFDIRTH
jgi:hypothetical protein